MSDVPVVPAWLRPFLYVAAVYHLLWAFAFIGWPADLLTAAGLAPPVYPMLVQGIGAVLLMFSLAYAIAAQAPARHAVVGIMAGLIKLMGAVGTTAYVWRGELPAEMLFAVLANDLLWLWPLGAWLVWAYRLHTAGQEHLRAEARALSPALLAAAQDQHGQSLASHQAGRPVLLVFLRHFGCTFCREALADLARERSAIEADGTRIVLVHMSPVAVGAAFLARYGLGDLSHISDPDRALYAHFELHRARWGQVFGWRSWLRGAYAGLWRGHGIGRRRGGDGFQMPGAFLIQDYQLHWAYRHASAADRPDYTALATCEISPGVSA